MLGSIFGGMLGNAALKDLKKYLKALLENELKKLDLVTRKEWQMQNEKLQQTQTRLAEVETALGDLKKQLDSLAK